MPFLIISLILSFSAILLSWTSWATNTIGITDVLQCFHKTATKVLMNQGLSIFIFAFFLYALLQSKALQSLFVSQRKWLQKRKYLTIALITLAVALLSSSLSWYDEFIHFYPLLIPLIMALGFDIFSSVICLYGGAIAGIMGLVSPSRMKQNFDRSFGTVEGKINYSGLDGIGFRIFAFVLFISIVIIFNIWYCSRNKRKVSPENNLNESETPPPFNRTKKIILAIAGVFLLGSIFAQASFIAKKLQPYTDKVHPRISSEYSEEEYKKVGKVGGEMEMAEVKKEKNSYWGTFGEWEDMAIDCWLLIGGIIICLLARQKIIKTLITATQVSIPIVLLYIFAAVPANILKESGVANNLSAKMLPKTVSSNHKPFALLAVFGLCIVLGFFISSSYIGTTLVSAFAPALLALSSSVLIYAAIFAWMGTMIGCAFSPGNGILMASLEKTNTSYKQFFKKIWILWLIMFATAFGLFFYQVTRIK